MTKTLLPIPKDLFRLLRNTNFEDTVRQLVLQQLDCDEIKLGASRSDARTTKAVDVPSAR